MHSFVFSALILVGLNPGVYFLRETNIPVFITDDARPMLEIVGQSAQRKYFRAFLMTVVETGGVELGVQR